MKNSIVRNGFVGAALILAVISLAGGAMYLLGHFTVDTGGTAMRIGVGITLTASGLAMFAGIWASRRSTQSGGGMIAAGAVPAAVCFWWTGVVPVVALSVAAFGIRRARRQARARMTA